MSDGNPIFENLKPARSLTDPKTVDEVTDAQDSIDWLIKNIDGHNGRVGMFGSSYMGYTSLMGAVSGHPNLKAVLSAAPSMDIFFEDFNRNGLFTLAYTPILDWFGTPKTGRHEGPWWQNNLSYWADNKRFGLAKDSYQFFLNKGALSNFDDLIPTSNYFWKTIKEHPNYDEYRQARNAVQYLRGIKSPVLLVGSWNDEQNLFGMLKSYKALIDHNKESDCRLVIGPWSHSGHKKRGDELRVGNVFYGDKIVDRYQKEIEFVFFEKHLKEKTAQPIPQISIFDTGLKTWLYPKRFPVTATKKKLHFGSNEQLLESTPKSNKLRFEFVSDPAKPVPYIESDQFNLFPSKAFMTSDQRFASKRPDVLTFVTTPLKTDLRLVGKIRANLKFSTNRTDADLMVKLIDVLPMDRTQKLTDVTGIKMNGYQQLVRLGQIRGRFRESYTNPKPFEPNQTSSVNVELLEVCHTFKAGHRIMVQIQSSLFPLFDRNPQNYVDNIYKAKDTDFIKATHTVHSGSHIEFGTLKD